MRFDKIQNAMDAVGTAVAVNLLLVVTASPLLVLLVLTDPFATWPLVAVAAVLAAPGVTAAFAAFARADENTFRAFGRGYLATWTRAIRVALVAVAAAAVVVVDVRFFADGPFAQAAIVVLAVVALLIAGTALIALAAIGQEPALRLRDLGRLSAWAAIRSAHLALVSIAVLAVFAVVFVNLPLLALSALAAPALYVVWANSRFALRAVLQRAPEPAA